VRDSAALVATTLLALVAGYVGSGLCGAAATPEIDDLARRIDALTVAPPPAASERRRESVERPTDEDRRIDALTENVAALRKAAASATPAANEAAADVRRLQKLDGVKLLAEIDKRLEPLMNPRVNDPVRERDVAATLRACDVLLARTDLAPADRAAGLMSKGRTVMRDDRAAAEAAFREALKIFGPASPLGHVVAAQLGWTASMHKDPRVAAEWFLSIAGQPDAAARERAMYELFAANVLAGVGDVARARELYRAVSVEFGTSEDKYARKFAEDSLAAVKKLDAEGGGK
jgi:hypothetical protein